MVLQEMACRLAGDVSFGPGPLNGGAGENRPLSPDLLEYVLHDRLPGRS